MSKPWSTQGPRWRQGNLRETENWSGAWGNVASCASAALAFLIWRLWDSGLPYSDDELGYYIPQALRILDSREPWRAALSGVAWHPPLLELFLATSWKVLGYSIPATRILLVLCGAATVAATAVVALRIGGISTAVGSSLLLASTPLFFYHGTSAVPEVLVTLSVATVMYSMVRKRIGLLIAALTAGGMTKPTSLLILPAVVFYILAANRSQAASQSDLLKRLLAVVGIPVVVVSLWFVLQTWTPGVQLAYGPSGGSFEQTEIGAALLRLREPRRLVVAWIVRFLQISYFDYRWVATLAMAVFLVRATCRRFRDVRLLVVAASTQKELIALGLVVLLYIGTYGLVGVATLPRYLVPCLPAFSILTAVVIKELAGQYYRLITLGIASLYLSSLAAPSYRVGRFQMGAWNDHAGYREIVAAYQDAFRFVEQEGSSADVMANYPASTMAGDIRLGYVRFPHQVTPLPHTPGEVGKSRALFIVAGGQSYPLPTWLREHPAAVRRTFGSGLSEVIVVRTPGNGWPESVMGTDPGNFP